MTMVIRIEVRIFDQIVSSVSFGPHNGNHPRNAETLKTIVCHMAPLAKLTPEGGSYLFVKYDGVKMLFF